MNETRRKGNFTGGYIIYGYKVVNGKVQIDEERAEVVRFIYEEYAKGVYVKDIIRDLTNKGIYNRGKPFAKNTIYNILKNEKYAGIYRHNNEVFENIYPAIVPMDIYEVVRQKTDSNKYGKRSVDVVYLLRNKVKCGYCGSAINAERGTAKNGEVKRYYKCMGRKHNNGCKKAQVRKEVLEQYVIDNIIEKLGDKDTLEYIVDQLLELQERKIQENTALKMLVKEQRQTENSINNIMSAIENGGTSNTAMKRLRELENKNEELEKQIRIERAKTACRISKEEIERYYKTALQQEPQMLINYLVKEILLFNDKMEIIYNTPRTLSLDESQGFLLYDGNSKMQTYETNGVCKGKTDFRLVMKF